MKIIVKKGYYFLTGMFWQIPDDGKRTPNFTKIIKDIKLDYYCSIKKIAPTWGFCSKDDLKGHRKVASLGKYIVECSNLSLNYSDSIICYKFKSYGEEEDGQSLDSDLYGYIVLLNGTICPDDGEYVSTFDAIRESILQISKKHAIETLYLPLDVSEKFFSIFERLSDSSYNDNLLWVILKHSSMSHLSPLREFIQGLNNSEYALLLNYPIFRKF